MSSPSLLPPLSYPSTAFFTRDFFLLLADHLLVARSASHPLAKLLLVFVRVFKRWIIQPHPIHAIIVKLVLKTIRDRTHTYTHTRARASVQTRTSLVIIELSEVTEVRYVERFSSRRKVRLSKDERPRETIS